MAGPEFLARAASLRGRRLSPARSPRDGVSNDESSVSRSVASPHDGDALPRAQAWIGGDQGQIAIKAMGDQHAIEGIPMLPFQRARRLDVSSVDREFEEPGRKRRGARRSLKSAKRGDPLLEASLEG